MCGRRRKRRQLLRFSCIFTFRFGAQKLPRVERGLWLLAALGAAMAVLAPIEDAGWWFDVVWQGTMAVFLANCLQFQWHAWRPRAKGRRLPHMLLAVCWLVFLLVAASNFFSTLGSWQVARNWAALSGPLVMALVTLLLVGLQARQIRSAERFNRELEQGVARARADLAQALQREHAQALDHTKLQERMQIAHDLHDGLGGSLVRSMAMVEQAPQQLGNARVMALLKMLRDDLRQVIDSGSSSGVTVPETPGHWVAPLRHRFTRVLDELGVQSHWRVDAQWKTAPTALQCLGMLRFLEEAFTNIIKHAHARHVQVVCTQPDAHSWVLSVQDDGVGFHVGAVMQAGMSVGMRSMQTRMARLGGRVEVLSQPGCTVLTARIALAPTVVPPVTSPLPPSATPPVVDASQFTNPTPDL